MLNSRQLIAVRHAFRKHFFSIMRPIFRLKEVRIFGFSYLHYREAVGEFLKTVGAYLEGYLIAGWNLGGILFHTAEQYLGGETNPSDSLSC